MSLITQVNDALKEGKFLPEFLEENRLLNENDALNKKFNTEMQRIYDRLLTGMLGPDYAKDEFAVKFMLQVDDDPNAGIWTFAKPPVIQFSTGLLKLADTESQIAAVLAHELGHNYFEQKIGAHSNGKLEELGADLHAPYMLRMANYPQTAMTDIIKKLPDDSMDIFATYEDPHPSKQVRLSALATAERALSRGASGMGEQRPESIRDAPNTGTFNEIARQAKFESHVDRALQSKSFHRATTEKKIEILTDFIQQDLAHSDPYFTERGKDIAFQISRLPIERGKLSHEQALNALVDAVVISPQIRDGQELYKALQKSYYRDDKEKGQIKEYPKQYEPIGPLKKMDDAIEAFTAAKTTQDIHRHAEQINALADKYDFSSAHWIHYIKFNGFDMPNMEKIQQSAPISPPWEAHTQAALNNDDAVLKALARLDVVNVDPRLEMHIEEFDSERLQEIKVSKIHKIETEIGTWGNRHEIIFDEHGKIAGVERVKTYEEKQREASRQRSERQQALEHTTLKTVDWSLLESDFLKFTIQYKEVLIPPSGYHADSYPFLDEFITRTSKLLEKDHEVYAPLVASYLSDYANKQHGDQVKDTFTNSLKNYNNTDQKIDVNHPVVQFVLEDEFHLFEPMDKAHYLSYTSYYESVNAVTSSDGKLLTEKTPEQRWLVDNSKIFNDLPANSVEEFKKFISDVSDLVKPYDNEVLFNESFLADLVQYEAYRTLSRIKEPLNFEDITLFRDIESFQTTARTRDPLHKVLVSKIAESSATIIDKDASAEDIIEQFKLLAAEKKPFYPSIFINTPALRQDFQDHIKETADTLHNGKRIAFLEELLFSSTLNQSHPNSFNVIGFNAGDTIRFEYKDGLVDPGFRNWATLEYASSLVQELGKDDGTTEYQDKFKEAIERLVKGASKSNAITILQHLSKPKVGDIETGNILQLQRELSDYMKDKMEMLGLNLGMSHNFNAALGEAGLKVVTQDSRSREITINFLTEPFSEEKAKQYIEKIETRLSSRDKEKFLSEKLSPEAKIEQVKLFHENFWDLPYEGRMLTAKIIMFPPEQNSNVHDSEFRRNIDFVMGKALPIDGKNKESSKEGRLIVESYLEATENPEDKRILASAMLVAHKPSTSKDTSISSGEALNLILDALGPAGRKLSQAIESHPATPQDIKDSFADSKTMAVSPRRDEIMKMVDQYKPETPNDAITHVGKVLGAGSYGVTVAVTKASGDETAITFLYPHVREQAQTEFDVLEKAANILAKKQKRFAPVIEMVRQAQSMSLHETDMELAAKQADVASKLYDNVSITVNGETFDFSAAKFLSYGKDYKEFEIIAGDHFNDLAKNSKDDAHIKNMATAQLTLELFNIFSGRPFDHDRHGGQQKIVENTIGQFDFGAMGVTETSPRQKQLLGHVIAGALKESHLHKTPFNDAIKKQVDKCADNEAERDFLAQVQRGLLALGNFQQHVGGEDALKPILGAIYVSGGMDQGIIDGMRERVGGIVADKIFKELEKAGKSSGIVLNIPEQQFDKSPDSSPLSAPPKDALFENIPVEKEVAVQTATGVTLATLGAIGLAALQPQQKSQTQPVHQPIPAPANDNKTIPNKDEITDLVKQNQNMPDNVITHAVYMQERKQPSQQSGKEDHKGQIIKGAAIAVVAVGTALAIDAVTGRHGMKALSEMAHRVSGHVRG
jgi:hypothetical protein